MGDVPCARYFVSNDARLGGRWQQVFTSSGFCWVLGAAGAGGRIAAQTAAAAASAMVVNTNRRFICGFLRLLYTSMAPRSKFAGCV